MPNNPAPSSILNRKITLGTVNEGVVISEAHLIYGPYAQNLTVSTLASGNKKVIPLTNNTGEGAHFLKVHFPSPTDTNPVVDSTLYVTFCKKDITYTDGYKDYVTNVPSTFIDDLKQWIDNGRTPNTSGTVRYRKLSFVGYGRETAQPQNALTFDMRFNYVGTPVVPQTLTSNPNTSINTSQNTSQASTFR